MLFGIIVVASSIFDFTNWYMKELTNRICPMLSKKGYPMSTFAISILAVIVVLFVGVEQK
jgi:hypothetical protein